MTSLNSLHAYMRNGQFIVPTKGHNRKDMQADDYLTIPCIFIMGSNTLCGRFLATFSPHDISQLHLLSISRGIWE